MLQVRALGRRFQMLAVVAMAISCAAPASALADGPGDGAPWVASLGDSAISGEAGRWAGNTNSSSSRVDALGASAYRDNATGTAEAIPGCHRSKSAEIHIGVVDNVLVNGLNLACSGARSATHFDGSTFKPGLDFYSDTSGRQGQALALREFAATHNVKAVVVLIGANDYGFADIVQTCVADWLTSPSWLKNYCQDDSNVRAMFTTSNVSAVTAKVRQAYANVRLAMEQAGYSASQWTLYAQTYSSPLPNGSGFRYPETGFTRQTVGGCGTWNRDADWANGTVVTTLDNTTLNAASGTGAKVLDMRDALVGHRLCERTVGLLEERGIATWQSPGAADQTEWVSQIRTATTITGPYQLQEDAHPSYWGQLALRNCFRLAYASGLGGHCTSDGGLNNRGEPNMTLGR
jgi:hypothetical protein